MRKRTGTAKPRAPRKPRAITVTMQPFECAARAVERAVAMLFEGSIAYGISLAHSWAHAFEVHSTNIKIDAGGRSGGVKFVFRFDYDDSEWDLEATAIFDQGADDIAARYNVAQAKLIVPDIGDRLDVRNKLSAQDQANLASGQMRFARKNDARDPDDDIPF